MEPKGKTSFIPKKPVSETEGKTSSAVRSLAFVVTFIIFILSLIGAGGVYFYKGYLQKQISQKKQYLEESKEAFEPDLIQRLKVLDDRMRASQKLLDEHISPSAVFSVLEQNTLKTVRFENMTYQYNDGKPTLKLTGDAAGFDSVALQSDIFGEHDLFLNPVFASLGVNQSGRIGFDFSSSIAKEQILYKNSADSEGGQKEPAGGGESGGEGSGNTPEDNIFMEGSN